MGKQHLRVAASALVVRVADVVDADPEREQRVFARPRRSRRLQGSSGEELVLNLFNHRDDGGLVRCDEVRVNGGTAVCIVVRQDQGLVEYNSVDVNPVCPTDRSVTLQMVRFFGEKGSL